MNGDHPWSPRRDDRQNFDPQESSDGPGHGPADPHEDDIRVAGASFAAPGSFGDSGAPAGDTAGLPAIPGNDPGDPYAPQNDPYAAQNSPYAAQGDSQAGPGDPYSAQGGSFGAQAGSEARPGDPFAAQADSQAGPGDPYAAQDGPFAAQGDSFAAQGDSFGPQGDSFGPQGDSYAAQGGSFGAQGDSLGAQGDSYGMQGDSYGMQGDSFGAQGRSEVGPGDPYAAQGGPFTGGPMRARDEISGRSAPRRLSLPSGMGVKVAAVAAGALVVIGGGGAAAFALTSGGSDSGSPSSGASPKAIAPLQDAAAPKVDVEALEAQRRKQALDRASRATRGDSGKAPPLHAKGSPLPTKTPDGGGGGGGDIPKGDPVPAGEAQSIAKSLLPSYGFSGKGQFSCLVSLWNKESHWNTHAANPSGAYGIPQALPGSKMASAGPDWRNNAKTQIKWGLGYIKGRYGTPCGAWSHSQSTGWY